MTRRILTVLLSLAFCAGISSGALVGSQQTRKTIEPLSEASKQWLEEVVPYIITAAERDVFLRLPTETERVRFIEAFWKKRDPKPGTGENEFKAELYRRIAAANRLFGTGGLTGWRTDRGKIYILLGPPKEIQRDMNPQSSANMLVSVFSGPKETWQYWDLPNPKLPYNMEFVFVDKFGTGNYQLENTYRVDSGRNRPFDASQISYQFDYQEWLAEAQKNPFEGLDRLREVITTQVNYTHIPFHAEAFFFKGAENKTFVPLALEVQPSALTAKTIEGTNYFSLGLILNVSDPLGRIVFENSKDLNFKMSSGSGASGEDKPFLVETALDLEPGPYRLHWLVLDNFSGKVGTSHEDLIVPSFGSPGLALSDVLLTAEAPPAGAAAEAVAPAARGQTGALRVFRAGGELNIYVEVYNLTLDAATGLHKIAVDYSFLQGGNLVTRVPSVPPKRTADRDCRIRTSFRLGHFKTGEYVLRIQVTDELSGRSQSRETFLVINDETTPPGKEHGGDDE